MRLTLLVQVSNHLLHKEVLVSVRSRRHVEARKEAALRSERGAAVTRVPCRDEAMISGTRHRGACVGKLLPSTQEDAATDGMRASVEACTSG